MRKVAAIPEIYDHLRGILPKEVNMVMAGVPEELRGEFPGDPTEKDSKIDAELKAMTQLATNQLRGIYHTVQHQYALTTPFKGRKGNISVQQINRGYLRAASQLFNSIPEQFRLFPGGDAKQVANVLLNYRGAWHSLDTIHQHDLVRDMSAGRIVDPAAFLYQADERGNPLNALQPKSSLFNIHQNTQVMSDRGTRRAMKARELAATIARKYSDNESTLEFIERELALVGQEASEDFTYHLSDAYVTESMIASATENHLQTQLERLEHYYEKEFGEGDLLIKVKDQDTRGIPMAQAVQKAEERQKGLKQEVGSKRLGRERINLKKRLQRLKDTGRKDDPEYAKLQDTLRQTYEEEGVKVIPLGAETGADLHISFQGKTKIPSKFSRDVESDRKEFLRQVNGSGHYDKEGNWVEELVGVDLEARRKILDQILGAIEDDELPVIITKNDGKGGRDVVVKREPYPSIHEGNRITQADQNERRTFALDAAAGILDKLQEKARGKQNPLLERFNALDGSERGSYQGTLHQRAKRISKYVDGLILDHPIAKDINHRDFDSIKSLLTTMISGKGVGHDGKPLDWNDMAPKDNPTIEGYVNDYLDEVATGGIMPSPPVPSSGTPVPEDWNKRPTGLGRPLPEKGEEDKREGAPPGTDAALNAPVLSSSRYLQKNRTKQQQQAHEEANPLEYRGLQSGHTGTGTPSRPTVIPPSVAEEPMTIAEEGSDPLWPNAPLADKPSIAGT
jgi:hypothetical protein